MALSAGQVLNNRYRIVKLLGQGGFGAVYRAWDMNMKAACAVKENFDTTPAAQSQFEREATLLFGLRHHNLPRVYDHFLIANQGQYLVMDFIEGQNLQEMLDQGGAVRAQGGQPQGLPLPEGQVLTWIGQVAEALGYMHRQNPPVIHRDIKPANIVINPECEAVLVDFGIAKAYDPNVKTTQGARAVTPGYSPHEQYGQGTTDARSDVYSLGATLYTLLTGVAPLESIQRMVHDPLLPPRQVNPAISAQTSALILKAMSNDPDGRYADGGAFKTALEGVGRAGAVQLTPTQVVHAASAQTLPVPTTGRRPGRGLLLGGVIVAILLLIGGIWAWNAFIRKEPDQSLQGTATAEKAAMQGTLAALTLPSLTSAPSATFLAAEEPKFTLVPPTLTFTPVEDTPAPELGIGSSMVSEKDGMTLMYVPAGEFLMGEAGIDENPQRTVNLEAFWIDRTEVTNGMYAKCVATGACRPPAQKTSASRPAYYGATQFADYPVIRVTYGDAEAYCRWAGRQLPTGEQWEKAARGVDGRTWPWGNQDPTCVLANGKSCVGDTNRVGSYPAGASPYGALDMSGNVSEWTDDIDTHGYPKERGGDFFMGAWPVWSGFGLGGDAFTVGFRCAAPEGETPVANITPVATVTLAAAQTSVLSSLGVGSSMLSEVDGMTLMYVPAGEFLMGSKAGDEGADSDETPQHKVTLDAFWIDQTEVTNAMYAQCVASGACQTPSDESSSTRSAYYTDPQYGNFPVIWVSWNDADSYCRWAGRRLLTEAEWEKAARGENGQIYPWGNQSPADNLVNFCDKNCPWERRDANVNDRYADTAPVGSYPDGASPYGALDMAGNAWEWVSSLYEPYPYQENDGRDDPNASGYYVIRGGSWDDVWFNVRAADRAFHLPAHMYSSIGFRCARSP